MPHWLVNIWKSVNWSNWALVLVGVIGARYAIRTLKAVERQAKANEDSLLEIRAGGAQTAQLIGNSAAQVTELDVVAKAAEKSAAAAEKSATVADFSIKLASKHLELTERPWLNVQASLESPLSYDEQGAWITVRISLHNFGRTPAIGILIEPRFYLMSPKRLDAWTERTRICKELAERQPGFGTIVFPRQTSISAIRFGASPKDIEESNREIFGESSSPFYCPNIIIAVSYKGTLDESAKYYTGVLYDFSRYDPSRTPSEQNGLRIGENVPMEVLTMSVSPFGGIVAR